MSRSGSLLDALDNVAGFYRSGETAKDVKKKEKHRQDRGDGDELTEEDKRERKHGEKDKDRKRHKKHKKREEKDSRKRKSTDGGKGSRQERRKRKKERRAKKKRMAEDGESEDSESEGEKRPRAGRGEDSEGGSESSEEDRIAGKDKKKHKRRRAEREVKDGKHRKRKRRKASSESEDSESDDEDGEVEEVEEKGDVGGDAEQIVMQMLAQFGDVAGDLKQLLGMIDSGQAVDISGLPDPKMKSSLKALFKALKLRKSTLGLYSLPAGATPTLRTLAPALNPRVLDSAGSSANGSLPPGKAGGEDEVAQLVGAVTDGAPEGPAGTGAVNKLTGSVTRNGNAELNGRRHTIGAAMPPHLQKGREDETTTEADGAVKDETRMPVIGAAMPPSRNENGIRSDDAESAKEARESVIGPAGPMPDVGPKKRLLGPAMPSPELLAAAAKLTEAQRALDEAEEELDSEPLIGPVPPAAAMEAENATEAERYEEVARILAPDATEYNILGVTPETSNADMKKRYWKLSLLVHPDKCSHPQAQQAFTALNQALKDLQDPTKRAIIDGRIADKKLREEYEADLKARREAAEWRRLRGEAVPGDDEVLDGPVGPKPRDTWMTELPPERQARQATTNTFFSRKEKTSRGDTSAWTDSPEEKAKKAKQMYLEAYQQAAIQGPTAQEVNLIEQQKAMKAAELMDSYNEKKRAMSLMEVHQKEQVEASKKKRKKEKGKGEKSGEKEAQEKTWAEDHPWRPWNRESDLEAGRKTVKLEKKDLMSQGLSSRFSAGAPGERKFL